MIDVEVDSNMSSLAENPAILEKEVAFYGLKIMEAIDAQMVAVSVQVGDYRKRMQSKIFEFIRHVYDEGYRDFFLRLDDEGKEALYQSCRTRSLKFYAALEKLAPRTLAPSLPGQLPFDSFDRFCTTISDRYSGAFDNLGSKKFQEALFEYYVSHQTENLSNADTDETLFRYGSYDGLMISTCLALRSIHGEKRIIELLNLLVKDAVTRTAYGKELVFLRYDETRVYALDLFMILQSGVNFEDMPLSWALQFIPDEWRNERRRFQRSKR